VIIPEKQSVDLLLIHAGTLLTLDKGPSGPLCGSETEDLGEIPDAAVAIQGETVVAVGSTSVMQSRFSATRVLDVHGRLVLPGWIDCHTHPVFSGTRENEFAMRVAGSSYEDIARAGGGIRSSVRTLRLTETEDLLDLLLQRLDQFLLMGTTTVEAKSGYGLSTHDEVRSLEVIHQADQIHPIDLIPTFMGAHEFPDEFRSDRDRYIDLIIQEMIPIVAERNLARFCDVFCENEVFSVEESRRILLAAKDAGMLLKIHAEELASTGGARLAIELECTSADHLVQIPEDDIAQMARSSVVAVLLPGTTFHLGKKKYAPAQIMYEAGLPIALATDFNPGSSMTQSLPMITTLACLQLGLSPHAALAGITRNAACALDLNRSHGRIAPGYQADLVVVNAPSSDYLPYHYASNRVHTVIKRGQIVVSEGVRRTP
jgi:imidazolonepropionase